MTSGLDNGDGSGTAADGQLHADEIDYSYITCARAVMVKDIYSGSMQQFSRLVHSRWQHPLFQSQRRNQRKRIVEERWNCLRHGDGQGHQQRKLGQFSLHLTAVGNTLYFQATTEPTEANCGRAMEQPQAR